MLSFPCYMGGDVANMGLIVNRGISFVFLDKERTRGLCSNLVTMAAPFYHDNRTAL